MLELYIIQVVLELEIHGPGRVGVKKTAVVSAGPGRDKWL